MTRAHFWTGLLLLIEFMKLVLTYGVPFMLRRISEEMPRDSVGETAFKRAVRLLRRLGSQEPSRSINDYLMIYEQYHNQDQTEPFTEQERALFQRFFSDFTQTSLLIDEKIVLLFPSFILRIDSTGIDFDSESAMKLIQPDDFEICPICHDDLLEPAVKLKCEHRYCLTCIARWLQEKTDCPLCRKTVS